MASAENETKPKPWYAAFPAPQSEPGAMARHEVLALMQNSAVGRDFVLVDLRRTDHEVC